MIVDSSINSDLYVVSGNSVKPVDVDDVGLHIDDMDFISERIEVLKS